MTDDLKVLMDRAATRSVPYVPDTGALLGVAHQRARRRRLVGAGAALGMVIALGVGVGVVRSMLVQEVDPAAKPTRPEDRYSHCVYSTGRRVRDTDPAKLQLVASATDGHGSAQLRWRDPSAPIAFCQYAPRQFDIPGRSRGGLFITQVPVDGDQEVVTIAGRADWAGPGVRVVVTNAANTVSEPKIQSGWFIYRVAQPVDTPLSLAIRYYDVNGRNVITLQAK